MQCELPWLLQQCRWMSLFNGLDESVVFPCLLIPLLFGVLGGGEQIALIFTCLRGLHNQRLHSLWHAHMWIVCTCAWHVEMAW